MYIPNTFYYICKNTKRTKRKKKKTKEIRDSFKH